VHGLKGCISCGYPYKYDGGESHTCERCGKFVRLKCCEKNKKTKRSAKKQSGSSNKSIDICIKKNVHSEKNITRKANNGKIRQEIVVSKENKKSNSSIFVKQKNDDFGVSIRDILDQAILNKSN
jgi:hypothetical protein